MEYLGSDVSTEELMHYGRKGMKWYQNIFTKGKGGSGRKKGRTDNADDSSEGNNKSSSSSSSAPKSVKDMDEAELISSIRRLQLEDQYRRLQEQTVPKEPPSKAKQFVSDMWDRSISPALQEAGKSLIKDKLIDFGKKQLGLDNEDTVAALEKEVKNLRLTKEKTEIKDWLNKKANGTKSKEDEEKEYMENLKNEVNKRRLEETLQGYKDKDAAKAKAAEEAKNSEAKKDDSSSSSETKNSDDDIERVKGTVEKDTRTAKEKWDSSSGPIHDVDFDEPMSSSNVRDLVVVGQSFFDEFDRK